MTFWKSTPNASKVYIGKPMANVKVYVLDDKGQPVPPGVPGELYFGGETTAKGYLNMPEATEKCFVPNPFADEGCGQMYRTGDLVRWLPDCSNIEFVGRVDHQIKLRGFRIELGEIEAVLSQAAGVKSAVVLLCGTSPATHRLVAYIVPEEHGNEFDADAAMVFLRVKLPEYMVPRVFVRLEEMPMTSRGKLNRKALPEPPSTGSAKQAGASGFHRAESDTQRLVESIWQEALGLKQSVDIKEDFVALGGNSLMAGRITSQIRAASGVHIRSTAMYTDATIEGIARILDSDSGSPGDGKVRHSRGDEYFGCSSTNPCVLLFQLVSILILQLLEIVVFLPGATFLFNQYYVGGILLVAKWLPVVLAATVLTIALATVVLKAIVFPCATPGAYPVWGVTYHRWWFAKQLMALAESGIGPLLEETWLYNLWLRGLGMRVGRNVTLNTKHFGEPSLVRIDDDCHVHHDVQVLPHVIEAGLLFLKPIHVKAGCVLRQRATIVGGTCLEENSEVGVLATTGPGGSHHVTKVPPQSQRPGTGTVEQLCRVMIGVPFIVCIIAMSMMPSIVLIEWFYMDYISHVEDSLLSQVYLGLAGIVCYGYLLPATYFGYVVVLKWILLGRQREGKRHNSMVCGEFRTWIFERLIDSPLAERALAPWHSTEFLAAKYRLLGASVGSKTQPDFVHIIQHDLLTVGDGAVFGKGNLHVGQPLQCISCNAPPPSPHAPASSHSCPFSTAPQVQMSQSSRLAILISAWSSCTGTARCLTTAL